MSRHVRERVFLISLGCAKNQVDSEVMSASLLREGFRFVADPSEAEVIILNSCSFVREAVEENLQVLESLASYKRQGQCRCLVLAGCLVQRYGRALTRQLPDTDLFLGMEAEAEAGPLLVRHLQGQRQQEFLLRPPRPSSSVRTAALKRTPLAPWAYLKVAEGCANRCAYCTIPGIRGPLRSRPRETIVREARGLAWGGVREINLIAQDVAAYGLERSRGRGDPLPRLLKDLSRIAEIQWIRLLYCHPSHVRDELIDLIGEDPKICPYLDLPIQHASDPILRRMKRPYTRQALHRLIERLRKARPEIALRTTVMVGFPGETDRDFELLLDFLREARFHHVGVFAYSPEKGTASWHRQETVGTAEKERRVRAVMKLQAGISRTLQKRYRRTVQEVLVEGELAEDPRFLKARTRFQAPEVDGMVLITRSRRWPEPAGLASVRITAARTYDLIAEPLADR